jgi:hypothetical protein
MKLSQSCCCVLLQALEQVLGLMEGIMPAMQ